MVFEPRAPSPEPLEKHPIYKVSRQNAADHECTRRHKRADLEIRQAEDAVAAGAAVAQARAETDEQSAGEHPRELSRHAESDSLIEYPQRQRRRPSAGE